MKKYFSNTMTLEEVKTIYRKNAKALHPDHGGSEEAMKELNEQFEIAFKVAAVKCNSHETVSQFYTAYGWQGTRYDISLSTSDIAKKIREYVKYAHPTYKFSVTSKYFSGGSSINVDLMEYPVELTNYELYYQYAEDNFYRMDQFYINGNYKCWNEMDANDKQKLVEHFVETSNKCQLNEIYIEEAKWINPVVLNVLIEVRDFINSYRFSDCDSMIDYFHTNFYYDMGIGKWNKDAKLVEKTARIAPTKKTNAKRIA